MCDFTGADARRGDCTVTLAKQRTEYTLTALFADGSESPQSAPFAFTHDATAPVLLRIELAPGWTEP